MSVPNQIPESNYVGNGTTTTFAANFEYASDSDVFVTVNGVAPEIGQAVFANGVFTFITAPANGTAVRVYRSTPIERDTEYNNHDNVFRPRVVNIDFDRIWFVLQEYLMNLGITNQVIAKEIADRILADQQIMQHIATQISNVTTDYGTRDLELKDDYIQRDQINRNALELQISATNNALSTEANERKSNDDSIITDYILRDETIRNYIDQTLGALLDLPEFQGIEAQFIKDASGKNQQEINNQVFYITQSDYVNPMQFKDLLKNAVLNYNNILIKNGEYFADISDGISIKPSDGTVISFQPNARITVTPNNLERVYLFDLLGKKNVTFNYPTCVGDKYVHLGITGQWGHCFNLESCENVIINQPNLSKFWGDGIYVKKAKNCKIFNPVCDDNRRQGISVVSCDGLDIYYPNLKNTSGQPPAFGLDVEPNWSGESTKGLRLFNPVFENNGAGGSYDTGFCISTHRTQYAEDGVNVLDTIIEVELYNPVFKGDALFISAYIDKVKGYCKVFNPVFEKSKRAALYFENHQSDNFYTEIHKPVFRDCVTTSSPTIYTNPITFECTVNAVKTTGTKNVSIFNPRFISSSGSYNAVAVRNITKSTFTNDMMNVQILDVEAYGFLTDLSFGNGTTTPSTPHSSFKLTYSKQDTSKTVVAVNSSITNALDRTNVKYTAATLAASYYLSDNIPVSDVEFYLENNSSAVSALLTVRFGSSATPLNYYVDGLTSNKTTSGIVIPYGAHIKIKRLSSDRWKIVECSRSVSTVESFGATLTYDPPSLAATGTAGDSVTTTVTLTGATVGIPVQAAFSQYNAAIEISAQVSAANTVTVKFKNTSAAAVDLPSGTLTVKMT